MADECDFAADMELKAADAFVAQRLDRLAAAHLADSAEVCACGTAIPEARRKAVPGVLRCTFCQVKAERRGVTHGRA
ncbi:TraR/DksA C4-type zinc finger protein [Pseudomonas sp. BCRC 81390]|uniref:TraR/DksA C4-type zinc finger protein n=1 Tax=Pseudomonas sp. BCRC 81390 TaxID=3054778 RepID=UPI00259A9A07|nr:TraR/DksA C4-type zinc finger protein [Pseudomonas sp. BCRC 81390]MDM3884660.1 TraR/DksA C4-type zinc finger protein [Pseudomonas sp. BCRC 81390]